MKIMGKAKERAMLGNRSLFTLKRKGYANNLNLKDKILNLKIKKDKDKKTTRKLLTR